MSASSKFSIVYFCYSTAGFERVVSACLLGRKRIGVEVSTVSLFGVQFVLAAAMLILFTCCLRLGLIGGAEIMKCQIRFFFLFFV